MKSSDTKLTDTKFRYVMEDVTCGNSYINWYEDILDNFDDGEEITIDEIYYCDEKMSQVLEKLKGIYDEDITKVYFKCIDRGVFDWKVFGEVVRVSFPNVKAVFVRQNYGDLNYQLAGFDVLIVEDDQSNYQEERIIDNCDIRICGHYDLFCGAVVESTACRLVMVAYMDGVTDSKLSTFKIN